MQLGEEKFETKPHRGGGVAPEWNEEFELNVANQEELILKI